MTTWNAAPMPELGLELVRDVDRERIRSRLPRWDPRLWGEAQFSKNTRPGNRLLKLGLAWGRERVKARKLQQENVTPRSEEAPVSCFTGKEEDIEVGLQYFGKRYLSPYLGRWISADPLAVHAAGSADLNLYAYVSGHVLKNTDPLGLAETATESTCATSQCDGAAENITLPPPKEPLTIPEVVIEGKVPARTAGQQAAGKGPEIRQRPEIEVMSDAYEDSYGPGRVVGTQLVGAALSWKRFFSRTETKQFLGKDNQVIDVDVPIDPAEKATHLTLALAPMLPALRALTLEEGTTTVFRVEGIANQRLQIGATGNVSVQGRNMLFLNFGDAARAEQFLATRSAQGMPGVAIKSFEVPNSFVNGLSSNAVPESMARLFPQSPLVVDVTKGANQFGLRPAQIDLLEKSIVQGTGQ